MSRNLRIESAATAYDSAGASTLDVRRSLHIDGGTFLRLGKRSDDVSGHFTEADARRIGEWLMHRYGLAPYTASIGDVVQILPDAERYDGDEVDFPDVRRAKVVFGLDSDGEYRVEALDGEDAGETFYVAAAFLRHGDAILPEATKPAEAKTVAPAVVVGQEYRLLPDSKYVVSGSPSIFVWHGATRVVVERGPDEDGDVFARALDGSGPRPGVRRSGHVDPAYLAPLDTAASSTLKVGDKATVTGDSAEWYHGFDTGTAVTLTEPKHFSSMGDGFRVEAANGKKWNVATVDLAPIAPTEPAALKVGDVVALKPGAKTSYDGAVYFAPGVTRVRVVDGPDSRGDYFVTHVNGGGVNAPGRTDGQHVSRAYLGDPETTTTAPAWAVGDEAIVTDVPGIGHGFGMFRFRTGERIRIMDDEGARTESAGGRAYRAQSIDGRTSGMVYASALKRPAGPAAWAVGDEAIVTRNCPMAANVYAGTRVRITATAADSDGSLRAEYVSGWGSRHDRGGWFIPADALRRPADADAWAVGDIAIVTSADHGARLHIGDRVRITEVKPEGGYRVLFVSGRGSNSSIMGPKGWHLRDSHIRRP